MIAPELWLRVGLLLIPLALTAFAIGWGGTALIRRYAIRHSVLDIPNERSSHTIATPRGGGLAIAAAGLLTVAVLAAAGTIEKGIAAGLIGGGLLIVAVGWIDDHGHLPVFWRALAHFVASAWLVFWVGVPDTLLLGPWSVQLGIGAPVLSTFGLVWLTNLFNFMDGIDGIASVEAISVAIVGGFLLVSSAVPGLAILCLVLAAATLGFLRWNWPPARIFMGDAGSGFLGFLLGAIAIAAAASGAVPVVVWMILLGVFIFDATATLLRRLPSERVHTAHRRHAYQRAVTAGFSHRAVTIAVLAINFVLGLVAVVAFLYPVTAGACLVVAVCLLGAVYAWVERREPMWPDRSTTAATRRMSPQ